MVRSRGGKNGPASDSAYVGADLGGDPIEIQGISGLQFCRIPMPVAFPKRQTGFQVLP